MRPCTEANALAPDALHRGCWFYALREGTKLRRPNAHRYTAPRNKAFISVNPDTNAPLSFVPAFRRMLWQRALKAMQAVAERPSYLDQNELQHPSTLR